MIKAILIYYPSDKRSNVIETIACGFVNKGYQVHLLTQSKMGHLHDEMKKNGIICHYHYISKRFALLYYLNHLFYLVSFCKKNRIQAIQSHLQQANIIAVMAQYFIKAKVVLYRHHLIEPTFMSSFFDKVINKLGRDIVVPCLIIKEHMITVEKVNAIKIKLIPYVYDFEKYTKPNPENVKSIRALHECKLLVLLCGRFVPLKRNDLAIKALKILKDQHYDIKLMALDEGPELSSARILVNENNLSNDMDFLGYRTNVVDYIAACDVMINPSYTEASNNAIKEAGYYGKNVVVCDQVGDFSEYIVHKKNGYLANKENPLEDLVLFLKEIYSDTQRESKGLELRATILDRFQRTDRKIEDHLKLLVY